MYINNTGRMDIMLLLTDQYLDTIHQQVMQEFQVIEDDREDVYKRQVVIKPALAFDFVSLYCNSNVMYQKFVTKVAFFS